MSRILVVDANVARAAGETNHPTSKACRDALTTIKEICHRVAFDGRGLAEWKKHGSDFALFWQAAMQSRGKVRHLAKSELTDVSSLVERTGLSSTQQRAVLKDLHLVETALAVDRAVLSMDEAMRAELRKIAPKVPDLGKVVWVNPTKGKDEALRWLKAGARADPERRLGS